MAKETTRVIGMAAGVIVLADLAAWMGLAHGCEKPGRNGVIAGHVAIAPALAGKISATDVLFIIIRRPQGPPRPVAVKRIERPRFPVTFEITNQDVMVEEAELRGWWTSWPGSLKTDKPARHRRAIWKDATNGTRRWSGPVTLRS